jgi:hypothetical protein
MCCDSYDASVNEIVGECPDCGAPVDKDGDSPCDGSC